MFKQSISLRFLLIYSLIFFLLFSSSCVKDEDDTETTTTTIVGEWKCNDKISENNIYDAQSYIVNISKSSTNYNITNFGNLGINTKAIANITSTNITINNQNIDDVNTHGSGNITNKTINLIYFIDDEKIESTWNKQ